MKKTSIFLVLNYIFTTYIFASTPLWTFTPLTPTTVSITSSTSVYVDYLITNHASITHNISLQPFPFSVRNSDPFDCGKVFTLEPNQSCILSIFVDGAAIDKNFQFGPMLCEVGSQELCYIPSPQDILTVIFTM